MPLCHIYSEKGCSADMTVKGEIRILLYNPAFSDNTWNVGSQRAEETCIALSQLGISITIASSGVIHGREFARGFSSLPLPKDPINRFQKLTDIVRKGNFDLIQERVQTGNLISSGYGNAVSIRTGLPLVLEIHSQGTMIDLIRSLPWLPFSMWRSKLILSYAKIQNNFSFGVSSSRFIEVPNGFSRRLIESIAGKERQIFDLQALARGRKIVGYFGEFSKDKGVDLLLDIAELMRGENGIVFALAGKGPLESLINRRAQDRDSNLINLGLLSKQQVLACIAQCMITYAIYSNKQSGRTGYGGNPVKVVESLALGVPAIIPADLELHPSLRSLCRVVETRDAQIIADIVRKIVMGEESKKHDFKGVTDFSIEEIARRILIPAYSEILER